MKSKNTINIAIADDHDIVRSGLKSLLEAIDNYEVIIEASSGLELVEKLKIGNKLPDICIVDLQMSPLNGYETIHVLKKKWPILKTIVLSMHSNELLVSKVLQAGASGFLTKDSSASTFAKAIKQILDTGFYSDFVNRLFMQKVYRETATNEITERELQFLCLCCSDFTYKEIAKKMKVETRTIDNYRDSLFSKLNIHSRTGLAVYAITTGLNNLSVEYLSNCQILDII